MRYELITINFPEGEYNAKPGELVFTALELEIFLRDKHPTFTSAVVTLLPERKGEPKEILHMLESGLEN